VRVESDRAVLACIVRHFLEQHGSQVKGLAVIWRHGENLIGVIESALLVLNLHLGFEQGAVDCRAARGIRILGEIGFQIANQCSSVVARSLHSRL